jgi:hypothetical protein
MPPRARRSSRSMGSNRRKLVWATANTSIAAIPVAGGFGLDLTGNLRTAGASVLGGTVMRTHLVLSLPFVNVSDFWAVGLLVCRDVDLAAGIDPNTNPGDDWMFYRQYFPTASGAAVDSVREVVVDLRSKRKFQELEQRYGLHVFNHTGAAKTVPLFARTLVALP